MKIIYRTGKLAGAPNFTMLVDEISTDKYAQATMPQMIRYNLQVLETLQGSTPKVNQEPVVAGKYIIIYDLLENGKECITLFNHLASGEELAAYFSAFSPIMEPEEVQVLINQFRALTSNYDVVANDLIHLQKMS